MPHHSQLCKETLAGVDNDDDQEGDSNSDDNGKDDFALTRISTASSSSVLPHFSLQDGLPLNMTIQSRWHLQQKTTPAYA